MPATAEFMLEVVLASYDNNNKSGLTRTSNILNLKTRTSRASFEQYIYLAKMPEVKKLKWSQVKNVKDIELIG